MPIRARRREAMLQFENGGSPFLPLIQIQVTSVHACARERQQAHSCLRACAQRHLHGLIGCECLPSMSEAG